MAAARALASNPALRRISRSAPMRMGHHMVSAALHRYPFVRGFETIGLSKLLSPFAIGGTHAIARLRNGASLIVFTGEHVGRIISYLGDLDPRISHVANKILAPGDTVLDIGANVGWLSMVAAPLVGPTGRVHSFEPQQPLHTVLSTSALLNGFDQITVHPHGLSDADGSATLYVRNGNYGLATLTPQTGPGWTTSGIRLQAADPTLARLGLGEVRLMKLDVEGHEATILKAAGGFLDRSPPDVILFESNRDSKPLAEREVLALLYARGYRIFGFDKGILRVGLVEQVQGAPSIPESNDYVALRAGPRLAADMAALGIRPR